MRRSSSSFPISMSSELAFWNIRMLSLEENLSSFGDMMPCSTEAIVRSGALFLRSMASLSFFSCKLCRAKHPLQMRPDALLCVNVPALDKAAHCFGRVVCPLPAPRPPVPLLVPVIFDALETEEPSAVIGPECNPMGNADSQVIADVTLSGAAVLP